MPENGHFGHFQIWPLEVSSMHQTIKGDSRDGWDVVDCPTQLIYIWIFTIGYQSFSFLMGFSMGKWPYFEYHVGKWLELIYLVITHVTHPWGPLWTLATLGNMLENDQFPPNFQILKTLPIDRLMGKWRSIERLYAPIWWYDDMHIFVFLYFKFDTLECHIWYPWIQWFSKI